MRVSSRGFSLLEVTIALSISGFLFNAIWQLTAAAGVQREAAGISSQAVTVSAAANSYIGSEKSTLLALSQLSALGNVARVKITDLDTGDTANSIQGTGHLPQSFANINSYGQAYALFVRREDAGTIGVADAGDRLVGLLLTTGGDALTDRMGAKVAGNMGAAGGFLYADNNPAVPLAATTARGSAGGWQIDLSSAGWVSIGSVAKAGHLALLVNLLSASSGGGSGGGGASSIDDLEDAKADYTTGGGNLLLGDEAGGNLTTGKFNTATGWMGLATTTTGSANVAMGVAALYSNITGNYNVGIGGPASIAMANAYPLQNNTTGERNMAIGSGTLSLNVGGSDNIAIGYQALYSGAYKSNNIAIGTSALDVNTGDNNLAIGRDALGAKSTGSGNTAIGYLAGSNISSGDNNIMIGNNALAPASSSTSKLNIGDTIFGDLSTDQVNIGSATMVTGIGFDVGTNTSASRLSAGTTLQRPTCTAALEGAQRFNIETKNPEYCAGGQWLIPTPSWTSVSGTPPTPFPTTGYFVLTESMFDGATATSGNARCLAELTTKTNWMGYADANARGLLNASHVRVFAGNEVGTPYTTYYFARVGDIAMGGALMTTGANGTGPFNNYNWAAANYFGGNFEYWTHKYIPSSTEWGDGYNWGGASAHCNTGSNGSSAYGGMTGYSGTPGSGRFGSYSSYTCDTPQRYVCFVHP